MKILIKFLLMITFLLSVIPLNASPHLLSDNGIEVVVFGDDKSQLMLFIVGDKYYLENKGEDFLEKVGLDADQIETISCTTEKTAKIWKSAAQIIPKHIDRVVTICEIMLKDSISNANILYDVREPS